jgi:BNR/Asp-box repeat
MTGIRVLVGTRKGAFILRSDGRRKDWTVDGPHFAGWEVFAMNASPLNPDRLYAAPSISWSGQVMQRSDDGGKTWQVMDNHFQYQGTPTTHQWYDGTQHPWEFKRVWNLSPSLTDPDTIYAGAEDAALFKSTDGGASWQELGALRDAKGHLWQPGAGGMCLHTIVQDPGNLQRLYVAISAAGAFRTDDGGAHWLPINKGLHSPWELPDPDADVGHCVHSIAMHPSRPDVLFMQKHWDVNRSDNAGALWHEVSGNLPSDFGFPIHVHAHEPNTVFVVPIKSDTEHYPPDGKLRVYRSRSGGDEWEPLTHGLPQQDCYVNVLRNAMAVDSLDPCGLYVGTTGGQVYASADGGDHWAPIVRDLPAVLSIEVQVTP